MVNILNIRGKKHGKDCSDWCPLKDGTSTGDTKYCDLSQLCTQLDMKSDWYQFYNHETGEYDFDYFCHGILVTEENKRDDDEVS